MEIFRVYYYKYYFKANHDSMVTLDFLQVQIVSAFESIQRLSSEAVNSGTNSQ